MTWTLSGYIARRFLATTVLSFLAVFLLIVVVELVERMGDNSEGRAGFADLIGMALLHAPSIAMIAAPFTVMLAAMACFARLARASETVVARAAGVSAWGLLGPAVIGAAALGVIAFSVYNPVAASMAARFEALEAKYFGRSSSSLSVSSSGLWLRQTGRVDGIDVQTVIRAERASSTVDRLWSVSVFRFATGDRMVERMEARTAVLEPGAWRMNAVRRWQIEDAEMVGPSPAPAAGDTAATPPARPEPGAGPLAETVDMIRLPTDLTPERIIESFAPPETVGFWSLPDFIAVLEEQGLAADRHKLQWHRLISSPLVFAAMVMIGAAFSMRPSRLGGLGVMALGCVATGFGYFFLTDLAHALGATGTIPVTVAAWAPPASGALLALGLLLHVEDG
ncbi:MAG: LptF/LptG family permease [Pseudomonadota bacterium]